MEVMDEVAIRAAGRTVQVVPEAIARTTRETSSSEGGIAGRRRNGVMCRWAGYHPVYFLLRVGRHLLRRPYVTGGVAMVWGYLRAGPSPYPIELRSRLRTEQAARLRDFARSPVRYVRERFVGGR
jgi:hypothetical protein